jgi:hypothetical protein
MKKPVIKNQPISALVFATALPVLDGQGILDDNTFLLGAAWEINEDVEDHVLYQKKGGSLRLRLNQDDDNQHRLKWELTIHAGETQVGYATIILRPGDMNGSTTKRLVEEALEAGDAEFKKWSDALSEARSILQA